VFLWLSTAGDGCRNLFSCHSASRDLYSRSPRREKGVDVSVKILLIADNPGTGEFVRNFLRDDDYAVCTALDHREGLRLAAHEKPDLITLDLSPPDESAVRKWCYVFEGLVTAHPTIPGAHSDDFGGAFRRKPAACSEGFRPPPVVRQAGYPWMIRDFRYD